MAAVSSAIEDDVRATVGEAYMLYETGRLDQLIDQLLTEETVFNHPGNADGFEKGFAGRFKGKAEIKEHMALRHCWWHRLMAITNMHRKHVIIGGRDDVDPAAPGTWVTVPGSCTATSRATGKSAFNEWTHLLKIQGGNITYFQNMTDFSVFKAIMDL